MMKNQLPAAGPDIFTGTMTRIKDNKADWLTVQCQIT